MSLLREIAEHTGLSTALTQAPHDTYNRLPRHQPGHVFTDLAAAIADGACAITRISTLTDRADLHGRVASIPTTWRMLDRIDDEHLSRVRTARAQARAHAWKAGARPDLRQGLCLDFDATITIAHSEKDQATPTWKKTFGFHPPAVLPGPGRHRQ